MICAWCMDGGGGSFHHAEAAIRRKTTYFLSSHTDYIYVFISMFKTSTFVLSIAKNHFKRNNCSIWHPRYE